MTHQLLERQLKKAGLAVETLPNESKAWQDFLEHISRAYTQAEQDRYLLERSLSIASEEMQQEISERKKAEEALQKAHDDLSQQNRQLVRVHELLRSLVEQMMTLIGRGASSSELMTDLQVVQLEFERMDKPNGIKP